MVLTEQSKGGWGMRHVGQSEMGNKGWSTNPCCGTGETLKSTECCFHTCCYEKGVKMILCHCYGLVIYLVMVFISQSKARKVNKKLYTLIDNCLVGKLLSIFIRIHSGWQMSYSACDVLSWCTTDNTEIRIPSIFLDHWTANSPVLNLDKEVETWRSDNRRTCSTHPILFKREKNRMNSLKFITQNFSHYTSMQMKQRVSAILN